MEQFFEACLEANREIASHLRNGLNKADRFKSLVGAGGDISSGIDLLAEEIFVKHLSSFGRIESEESGVIGNGEHTMIIDPIDGSSNILSDFPYYGTSVACKDKNDTTTMAVVCNLATKEIFFKKAGENPLGGDLEGDIFLPLEEVSDPEIGIFERAYAHHRIAKMFGDNNIKFRAPGAVALSLVYARSSLFFFYYGKYRSYDFAAGMLFCEGMEVELNDQYVIVSKEKKILDMIRSMIA